MSVLLVHNAVVLAASLARNRDQLGPRGLFGLIGYAAIDAFRFWDAQWYVRIATIGYDYKRTAFFPLYPSLSRAVAEVLGIREIAAAVLVSHVAFVLALWAFHRFTLLDVDEAAARRATWILALFPTAFFFSAAYTESLFLLPAVLALTAMRSRRWIWAGLWGALAALTRNVGVLLAVPLLLEYLWAHRTALRGWGSGLRTLLRAGLAVLPVGLGALAYMAFLWRRFGDPLSFARVQPLYYRIGLPPWRTVLDGYRFYLRRMGQLDLPTIHAHPVWVKAVYMPFQVLVVSLYLLILAVSFGRIRWSYWLLMLLSFLIPLSTATPGDYFMSFSRYLLSVPPLFLCLEGLFTLGGRYRRWAYRVYLACSLALLAFFSYVWTGGTWVA